MPRTCPVVNFGRTRANIEYPKLTGITNNEFVMDVLATQSGIHWSLSRSGVMISVTENLYPTEYFRSERND